MSARTWVEEAVVVDTGSYDNTAQLAADLGARVFQFPWCDDFSAARNESIAHANGKWIFWLDSDEFLDEANGRKLRELAVSASDDGPMAFYMQQHSTTIQNDRSRAPVAVNQVRMFRNRPEFRFEGRVHEQILPSIRRLVGRVDWTDIRIEHSGYDDPQIRRQKLERDLRLLHLELADRPDHPFALFNLGMTLSGLGQHEASIAAIERFIAVSKGDEAFLPNAYVYMIAAQIQVNGFEAASRICRKARERFPKDPTLLFHEGVLAREAGRPEDAIRSFESVLELDRSIACLAFEPDLYRKADQNIALCLGDMGKHDFAELRWRNVIAAAPDEQAGWLGLAATLVAQNKFAEAEATFRTIYERWPNNTDALHEHGKLLMRLGRAGESVQVLRKAMRLRPTSSEIADSMRTALAALYGPRK